MQSVAVHFPGRLKFRGPRGLRTAYEIASCRSQHDGHVASCRKSPQATLTLGHCRSVLIEQHNNSAEQPRCEKQRPADKE